MGKLLFTLNTEAWFVNVRCGCTNKLHFSPPKRAEPTTYTSHCWMPFHQNLSPSMQRSSPRWTLKNKEACLLTMAEERCSLLSTSPLRPSDKYKEQISQLGLFQNVTPRVWLIQVIPARLRQDSECIACLGRALAEAAFTEMDCSHCESISLASLHSWIAFFHVGGPAPSCSTFLPSQEPWRKKQRSQGAEQSGLSDLTPAQVPCASLALQRDDSLVLFSQEDQHSSSAASGLVSFVDLRRMLLMTQCHWKLLMRRNDRAPLRIPKGIHFGPVWTASSFASSKRPLKSSA